MKVHFERGKGDQRGKRRPQEEKGGQGVDEGGSGGGGLGGNVVDLLLEQLEYSQTIIPGGVSAPPTAKSCLLWRQRGAGSLWRQRATRPGRKHAMKSCRYDHPRQEKDKQRERARVAHLHIYIYLV